MRTLCAEARGTLRGGKLLFNRYELLDRLGSGGMGVVYSALDLVQAEEVAIKMLRQPFDVGDLEHRRFMREAMIASRLFHPNIVEVKDFQAEGEGAPYLIMELVRGYDLCRFLNTRGALIWPLAVDILRQIGSALHAAHTVGVIHRDIKPSNILLTPMPAENGAQQERFLVKVADFGISTILGSSQPSYTIQGQIMGTPEFLSPEATTGEPLDSRADQWSLGIVAYQMLAGRVPFRHRDELTTLLKIRTQAPRSLRSLAGDVPRHVTDAVEIALSKRREDRFATVQDFVRALSGLAPLHNVPRAVGPRSRTGTRDEAVPQPVSLSNPLPIYIEPDSDPGLLHPPARPRTAQPQTTYLHDLSAQMILAAPSRPDVCGTSSAEVRGDSASSSPCHAAEPIRPAVSRPESGAPVLAARRHRSVLRSAGWIAVMVLVAVAIQELKVAWPRRPQLLPAAREPSASQIGERPPGSPGRGDVRFLIVPRQSAEAAQAPDSEESAPAPRALRESPPAARLIVQRWGRLAAPDREPSPQMRRASSARDSAEEPVGGGGGDGLVPAGSQTAAPQAARFIPDAAMLAEPPPVRAAEPLALGAANPGRALPDAEGRPGPQPGTLRKRFASLEHQSGEEPHLPLAIRALYRGQTLVGRYLICVLPDGSVHSVTVKQAAAGTDSEIVAALRTWRYPVQPLGTLTCTAELLQFELQH